MQVPQIFRYREDRLPILLFTAYFVVDFIAFLFIDNPWLLLGYFLIGIFPKGNICAWNHHHQHCKTFKQKFLNWILELIYGLQTGITSNTWVLHHNLGHHLNYLDQTKDESRWKNRKGKKFNVFAYTLSVALTSYYRAFRVGKKHKDVRRTFLIMLGITLTILLVMFVFRPLQTIMIYLLPMFTSLLITSWATYNHHSGLETDDHKHASRNIESKWFNRITGNLGYHTAHHMRFGSHWSRLPKLHAKIRHEIPEECFVQPGWIFRMMDRVDRLISRWFRLGAA